MQSKQLIKKFNQNHIVTKNAVKTVDNPKTVYNFHLGLRTMRLGNMGIMMCICY